MLRKLENNKIKFILTLIVPALILLTRPFEMTINQSIILGTLVLVLSWWTTGVINKIYSSLFLLLIFSLFGSTPLNIVFKFPLSANFYMIGFSFLLSQGIVNSNVANRFSAFVLNKYANTPSKLIIMSNIFNIIMIFIIPQPFSRVILLASIYQQFFKDRNISDDAKEILLFSIFVSSTSTCMFFINGDIILNYSALQFGSSSIGWLEWAKYMIVPSVLTTLLMVLAFFFVFRKELKTANLNTNNKPACLGKMEVKEKAAIIIMGIVILLWMTEHIHMINSAIVALLGTAAMFSVKILDKKDLKSLNISLLVFLIAAFAIGSVMKQSGVASIIYSNLAAILPSGYSNLFIFMIVLIVMMLHMVLGSSITTLSVAIPGLLELTRGKIEVLPLILIAYITVNIHYLLPFQHVTIMIGAGNNYYSNKTVLRYGAVLTILIFVVIFLFYLPWWRFTNFI